MTGCWDAAWGQALDDLELDVERAEAILAGAHELADELPAFMPPALEGPLPTTLLDRARELLARQNDVVEQLSGALDSTRRQQVVAARFAPEPPPSTPVYVDSAY